MLQSSYISRSSLALDLKPTSLLIILLIPTILLDSLDFGSFRSSKLCSYECAVRTHGNLGYQGLNYIGRDTAMVSCIFAIVETDTETDKAEVFVFIATMASL